MIIGDIIIAMIIGMIIAMIIGEYNNSNDNR